MLYLESVAIEKEELMIAKKCIQLEDHCDLLHIQQIDDWRFLASETLMSEYLQRRERERRLRLRYRRTLKTLLDYGV